MHLVDLSIKEFCKQLASDSPAPGGGSVAALAGALSAALGTMVTRLTSGKKKYEHAWARMATVGERSQEQMATLLSLVDKDTDAYNQVMEAYRLPKDSDDEIAARKAAIDTATKQAAQVPLQTLRTVAQLIPIIAAVIEEGNPNCITDAGVAVQLMRTAALGAAYNVKINLSTIADTDFVAATEKETDQLIVKIIAAADRQAAEVESAF